MAATSRLCTTSLSFKRMLKQFFRVSRPRVAANFSRTKYLPGPTVMFAQKSLAWQP